MTFRDEQRALAAACWQLVGLADELADDDAWIRRPLFGTDVFVQRFEGELRGFHNVCAHRGYPLRTADAGTGPVKCGFHGWGYNKDGVPTAIPRNAELFGLSREQREALALPAIRVETIGRFVFAALGDPRPLADYLGPYAAVYRGIDAARGEVIHRESIEFAADWRLHAEISLDDYHLDAVHSTTFGMHQELPLHHFVYRNDGLHSCYLKRRDPEWSFDGFWRDVAAGAPFDQTGYKIFNPFPSLLLASTRDACFASACYALDRERTRVDSWVFAWANATLDATARREIAAYFATVFREDREACEHWQHGGPRPSVLGKLEERIGWFRDAYDAIVNPRREAVG